jgi:hypothetical protein
MRTAIVLAVAVLGMAACAAGNAGESEGLDPGIDFDGSGQGAGPQDDGACAVASDEARNVPVAIYIMFDKSGSMQGPKWSQSTAALQGFFMDPKNSGLQVALRFFPDGACDACNAQACSDPKVPAGALTELSAPTDAQEQSLLDAFVDVVPSGGTPLSPALDGALLWASGWAATHTGEKAVVVLVTDGEPSDCETDADYFVHAAAGGLNNAGVPTFAIGLEGSSESLMDAIAVAGGTDEAILIGTGNAQAELQAALDAIRDATVACEYQVPEAAGGQEVDPAHVNVVYQPGGGSDVTLGYVADRTQCTEAGGWYYDDALDPTKITFCPATCATVQGDPGARIELVFGCATVPA